MYEVEYFKAQLNYIVVNKMTGAIQSAWKTKFEATKAANNLNSLFLKGFYVSRM